MDAATAELLRLGLPGIVILGLSWACITLYKQRNADIIAATNTLAALQEARLADSKNATAAMVNVTAAMNNHIETNREVLDLLRTISIEYQSRRSR